MREFIKNILSFFIVKANFDCDYKNAIFMIGHMRAGTTALTNILCSRKDVSGFGEAHVNYSGKYSLGRLYLSLMKNNGIKKSSYIFDKILHSRYDSNATDDFFNSKGIFIIREPSESIKSIQKLFEMHGSEEYKNLESIVSYYNQRLDSMVFLWSKYNKNNRIFIPYQRLINETDAVLDEMSSFLEITPKIINEYAPSKVSRHGAGDPMFASKHSKIVKPEVPSGRGNFEISEKLLSMANEKYNDALKVFQKIE